MRIWLQTTRVNAFVLKYRVAIRRRNDMEFFTLMQNLLTVRLNQVPR